MLEKLIFKLKKRKKELEGMSLKNFHILGLFTLFFMFGIVFFPKSPDEKRLHRPFYFAPPDLIKYFSLGFSDLYADILWMRLIQDIDFCSSKKGLPIYDGKTKYQCEKGWSYRMTRAIIELAPRFLRPYEISGSIMSIIVGDKQGAKIIYDKAIKNFPNHWKIHFSAGYHYLMELNEEERAAELLRRSADLGGPQWLYALSAKIYGEMGKLFLSREILKEAIKKDIKGQYKKALELRLEKIEKKIQLLKSPF